MASQTWTIDTGTSDTSPTYTNSGTSNDIRIYNGGIDQIRITKAPLIHGEKIKRDPFMKRDFWDGVEWKEYTSYIPRKSITGKIIIGKMHKCWRTPEPRMRGKGLGIFTQYAKTKELFEEKLRGKA